MEGLPSRMSAEFYFDGWARHRCQRRLKLGVQIADALDRAHQTGVIHRDLEPGNIMRTRAGPSWTLGTIP